MDSQFKPMLLKCHLYKNLYWIIRFFTVLNIIFTGDLSPAELMMLTIGDVIKQLIEAHEQGKDIDLNK